MSKLKSIENISTAAEGFVFDHDGWSYKFTGNFAPINQILGLFKYGRKGIPPLENLNEAIDSEAKRKIVLYPGRFQPMGRHHAEVFKTLQKKHGSDNVFIVTSNKVSPPKSPLDFEEKKQIMLKHGIPDSQIIQAVSPYRIGELADQFDSEGDIIVYAVGKKDMDESPRFKNLDGKKKDGSPTYLKSYDKNENSLQPFENHAYVMVAPHVSIKLPNGEEMSGSTLRDAMRNLTPESFKEAMGWFDKDIYEMLKGKINESVTSLSEAILSIVEEVLEERSKASKDRVSKKISYLIDKEKKDPKQAAAIAYSMEDRGELGELRTNISGFYGNPPEKNKKKYVEPALQDDYEVDEKAEQPSEDSEGDFEEIEEISGAAAAGGYSLPLGMKPRYFNSPMPKVKGINIYNRKKKK